MNAKTYHDLKGQPDLLETVTSCIDFILSSRSPCRTKGRREDTLHWKLTATLGCLYPTLWPTNHLLLGCFPSHGPAGTLLGWVFYLRFRLFKVFGFLKLRVVLVQRSGVFKVLFFGFLSCLLFDITEVFFALSWDLDSGWDMRRLLTDGMLLYIYIDNYV